MVGDKLIPGDVDQDRFDRARRIDWLDLDAISETKVLMVGAGAIGNETAKDLVLSGFENITVVDMDHIVRSNLARCLFFSDSDAESGAMKAEVVSAGMKRIAPDVRVTPIVGMVQDQKEGFIADFDIVLGCLDNVLARLHLNSHCYHHKVSYIDAAMDGFSGKVQVVVPPETPCLQCAMNKTNAKIIEQRFSCTGNDISLFLPKIGAEITTTSIVAAVQVREALKLASGSKDIIKNVFYYNGVRDSADTLELEVDPECPNH